MFSKPHKNIAFDDVHARECSTPEGATKQFTAAKSNNSASRVRLNGITDTI